MKYHPYWTLASLLVNGVLLTTVYAFKSQPQQGNTKLRDLGFVPSGQLMEQMPIAAKPDGKLGERHYFNYKQWVSLLEQEANTLAQTPRDNVNVLLGDSISLWFPPELLPPEKYWLNQGISGETSQGLLKRLNLLDRTKPEKIYLMIGINDLIKGISKEEIVTNHQKIVRQLLKVHPESEIILISILPHGGQKTTWEGKDKLLKIPIAEIQDLNRQLAQIAKKEGVNFLNLYPFFADGQGYVQPSLTTDGLHLSPQGYQVWAMALAIFDQVEAASR